MIAQLGTTQSSCRASTTALVFVDVRLVLGHARLSPSVLRLLCVRRQRRWSE